MEYIKHTISDEMSLEITDTRLQLLVGAGLPDDVLDAWQGGQLPNIGGVRCPI